MIPAQEKYALNSENETIKRRTKPSSNVPTANGGPHRIPDCRGEPTWLLYRSELGLIRGMSVSLAGTVATTVAIAS